MSGQYLVRDFGNVRNKMDRQKEIQIEMDAYRWVGSSPCEGCEKFRECDDKEFECDEEKEWRREYEKTIEEFKNSYPTF